MKSLLLLFQIAVCLSQMLYSAEAEPSSLQEIVANAKLISLKRVDAFLDGGSVGYGFQDEKGNVFWIIAQNTFQYHDKPRKVLLSPHPPHPQRGVEIASGGEMEGRLLKLFEFSCEHIDANSPVKRKLSRLIEIIRNREASLPKPREIYDSSNPMAAPWKPKQKSEQSHTEGNKGN